MPGLLVSCLADPISGRLCPHAANRSCSDLRMSAVPNTPAVDSPDGPVACGVAGVEPPSSPGVLSVEQHPADIVIGGRTQLQPISRDQCRPAVA
eukprot:2704032-Alexandrium_andersonii.AAC.1